MPSAAERKKNNHHFRYEMVWTGLYCSLVLHAKALGIIIHIVPQADGILQARSTCTYSLKTKWDKTKIKLNTL